MSSEIVVSVEGVSKRFRLGAQRHTGTLREAVSAVGSAAVRAPGRIVSRMMGSGPAPVAAAAGRPEVWALRDVSFEVRRGEVLGIIGRNGAGKSTLLKILSRITEPTTGRVGVRGRVGSLLEVGTGFHPELTGRENIYLNGAILGMGRRDVQRRFDQIVAFAEVGPFLDTPVKRYSSGMYVRLGFAVAAHLEPDVLIVDEALAVGDAGFQKKCLDHIRTVVTGGRSVLLVSHNMLAVSQFCTAACWLEQGTVRSLGSTGDVTRHYTATSSRCVLTRTWPESPPTSDDHSVRLLRAHVRVEPEEGAELLTTTAFALEFDFWNHAPDARLSPSVVISTAERVPVLNTFPEVPRHGDRPGLPAGRYRTAVRIPAGLLNDGTYSVSLLIIRDGCVAILRCDDVLTFTIHDREPRDAWFGKRAGVVRPSLAWHTVGMDSDP